jgi:hypothetical protein
MRRAVSVTAAAFALIAPAFLAFASGGYHTQPRLIAAIVAWSLVLALALTGPAPLPRSRAGVLTLAGLTALTVWTALSLAWAPLGGPAIEAVQRLVLYTGVLLLAIGALRAPRALRAVEPALAAGAFIVIGYGLAGRLLPGIVELDRSRSAGGRLEQPITYWNGEGALAAIGFVLCARLAGDRTRHPAVRATAAAAAVPLSAGLYLSFSRGAIAVAVLGLVVLVAAARTRGQLRAAAITLATGVAAAASSAGFAGVTSLVGSLSDRITDGAVVLAILATLAAVAALVTARTGSRSDDPLPRSQLLAPAAAAVAVAVAVVLVAGGLANRASDAELAAGAEAGRLTTASSNRYEYWRVAVAAFGSEPLTGLGAGGFRVEWLRERPIPEAVRDTHSLELEFASELGLVGLAAFALMITGIASAAGGALRRRRALAAGPVAAALAWLLHASIDWDWQLPAVTLPAIVLAGALIVLAEAAHPEDRGGLAPPAPAGRQRGPRRERSGTASPMP